MTRFRHALSGAGWLPTDTDPDARFYTSDRGVTLTADSTTTRHRVGFRSRDIITTTSLPVGINNSITTFDVASTAAWPFGDPLVRTFKIKIDDEVMTVTSVVGTEIEVQARTVGNVAHAANAVVTFEYPYDGQGFVRLKNGRLILAGGALVGYHELVVNTIWYSDDRGRTWKVLVPNDPDDDTRPAPGHTFGFLTVTIEGVEWVYWIGGDPFAPTGNVFRSSDGCLTWELICDGAGPDACPTEALALFMYGALGTDLYVIGGQSGPLPLPPDPEPTILDVSKTVWVSHDYGATWEDNGTDTPADVFGTQLGSLPVFDDGGGAGLWVVGSGEYSGAENNFSNGVYKFNGATWSSVLADGHSQFFANRYHSVVVHNGRLWRFNGTACYRMAPAAELDFASGPRTITRDAGSWIDEGFFEGGTILVEDSPTNDGTFVIAIGGVSALTLTLTTAPNTENNVAGARVTSIDSDTASAHHSTNGTTWTKAFEQLPWGKTHAQAAIATFDGVYLTNGFQSKNLYVVREHAGLLVESWADQGSGELDLSQADDGKKPILDTRAFPGRPGLVFTLDQLLSIDPPEDDLQASFYEVWAVIKTLNFTTAQPDGENPPAVVVGAKKGSSWNNFGLNADALQYNQYSGGWRTTTDGAGLSDERCHLIRVLHTHAEPPLPNRVRLYIDGEEVANVTGNVGFDANTGWDSVGAGAYGRGFGEFVLGAVLVRTVGSSWGDPETALMLKFTADFR